MSNTRLKPCPFCCGTPKLHSADKLWNGQLYVATWVECEVCGAKTKEVWNTSYDDRPNDRKKEVVDNWNTRKPMQYIEDRFKKLFQHHAATKIVQRLVFEILSDWS